MESHMNCYWVGLQKKYTQLFRIHMLQSISRKCCMSEVLWLKDLKYNPNARTAPSHIPSKVGTVKERILRNCHMVRSSRMMPNLLDSQNIWAGSGWSFVIVLGRCSSMVSPCFSFSSCQNGQGQNYLPHPTEIKAWGASSKMAPNY